MHLLQGNAKNKKQALAVANLYSKDELHPIATMITIMVVVVVTTNTDVFLDVYSSPLNALSHPPCRKDYL